MMVQSSQNAPMAMIESGMASSILILAIITSEKWGQEVEAFVVLKHRISVADLQAHAAAMLGEPQPPYPVLVGLRYPQVFPG